MGKNFFGFARPPITCMVQADNPERIKELMKFSRAVGADAFGMQFERLKPEYRDRKILRDLFKSADDAPVYVTNYRLYENLGKSDEMLADELIELAECGGALIDVMGDFFAPNQDELTEDEKAVERQKHLIDELHKRGAKVLMSSHVGRFLSPERVLEMALMQKSRGADVCKIVTQADNLTEETENFRIVDLLRRKLGIPFLFLSGGESRALRLFGASFGNFASLCVYEHDRFATREQPLLRDMITARNLF